MQSYSNVENQEGDLEDLVTYLLSIEHHLPRSVLLDIETEKMDTSNLFHFLLDLLVSIVRRIYNVELLSIKDYGIDNIDLGKQDKILNYYNSIGFNISFKNISKNTIYNYLEDIKCDVLPDLEQNNELVKKEELRDYSLNIDLGNQYLNVNFDYLQVC